jgi:diaminopimelate epimerase
VLPFAKLQAAGNAYLVVDGRAGRLGDLGALARAMGDRHFGVGSDGLLVVEPSEVAAVRMRVINTDGSEAEMSGNGIRLFAKFVLDRAIAKADADGLRVETAAGVRTVVPRFEDGRMVAGRVAMGVPRVVDPALRLDVAGRSLELVVLSLGNPHAVWLTETAVADIPLAELGPLVERHDRFLPARTNFEVVNVLARDRLRVRVFERGEGETLSSGTGSTASAVAARVRGLTDGAVRVCLAGGELEVAWAGQGEALLEGPVAEVFTGEWPLPT